LNRLLAKLQHREPLFSPGSSLPPPPIAIGAIGAIGAIEIARAHSTI